MRSEIPAWRRMRAVALRASVLAMGLLLSTGCGVIPDRSNAYQLAERSEPLRLPEHVDRGRLQNAYPVPSARAVFVAGDDFKVPPPPDPGSDLLQEQFVVRAAGADLWLASTEPPGRLWPALVGFMQQSGATILRQESAVGALDVLLEPVSANARSLSARVDLDIERTHRLESRITQGIRRNSSEIRVFVGAESGLSEAVALETRRKLLDALVVHLNQLGPLDQYSLAAQNLVGPSRVELVNTEEQPHLLIALGFERAWAAVGQALQDGQIPLIDVDRSRGWYYVDYRRDPESAQGSWWSRWFGAGDDDVLSDRYNFKVQLIEAGDSVRVELAPTSQDTTVQDQRSLLNVILENLS